MRTKWVILGVLLLCLAGGLWATSRALTGGGALRQLTSGTADICPAFSPDGTRVAFLRFRGDYRNNDLCVADVATGAVIVVASGSDFPGGGLFTNGVSWSPDGQTLAVSAGLSSGQQGIWLVSLSGTTPAKATTWGELKRTYKK